MGVKSHGHGWQTSVVPSRRGDIVTTEHKSHEADHVRQTLTERVETMKRTRSFPGKLKQGSHSGIAGERHINRHSLRGRDNWSIDRHELKRAYPVTRYVPDEHGNLTVVGEK